MSNHFTYEIDERNIRLQLKGHVLATKEDDWHKFESGMSGHHLDAHKPLTASKINITFNRNLVMPLIFGIIILAFASLLVNFMSIKNQAKNASNTLSAAQPAVVPAPALATVNSTPQLATNEIKQQVKPVSEKQTVPDEVQKSDSPPISGASESKPIVQSTTKPSPTNQPSATDSNLDASTVSTSTQTPELSKKKRKKRLLESIESEQNSALRPTLVSEDRDAEIQPE